MSREKTISTQSHAKILGKMCIVLLKYLSKRVNFNVSEQIMLILKHGLLKQRKF